MNSAENPRVTGPLAGTHIVELGSIGPAPFGGMLLADLGAAVIRIDRPAEARHGERGSEDGDIMGRGKRSIVLDLKRDEDRETALELIDRADALIDPFRPGVTERLRLGPEVCLERNAGLVYARMTGWGQELAG